MSARVRARLLVLIVIGLCAAPPAVLAQKTDGPTAKQARQVLEKNRPLAEKGDPGAQYNMGVLYDQGYGVKQDFAKARQWYEKAAAQHYGRAEHNLGIMYKAGKGVTRDAAKSAEWFRRGADDGQAASQNNLAVLYMKGAGVPQNTGKAAFWTARAAAAGNSDAIDNLPRITSDLPAVHVNADNVNVRDQPNREARIVHDVDSDTVLAVLARRDDWTQVLLPESYAIGWVANFLLSDSQAPLAGPTSSEGSDGSSGDGANAADSKARGSAPSGPESTDESKVTPKAPFAGANAARARTAASSPAEPKGQDQSAGGIDKSNRVNPSTASSGTARVGVDAANLRSKPSKEAQVIGQLHRSDAVRLLDERSGWRYVRTRDGVKGWLAGYLLIIPSK